MKTVLLEEKLTAQMKNVVAIVESKESASIKLVMLKSQKEYINFLLDVIKDRISEEASQ